MKLSRSTWRYRRREATSEKHRLAQRLRALSEKHPRYGYRRIAALLCREGWAVGKRHVQKLRRAEGLRVPPTKRKIVRRGRSTGLPTKAEHRGHVWTWDFISDATTRWRVKDVEETGDFEIGQRSAATHGEFSEFPSPPSSLLPVGRDDRPGRGFRT